MRRRRIKKYEKVKRVMRSLIIAVVAVCAVVNAAAAMEFLEKRNCTLAFATGPRLHTTCTIKGGIQGGTIDVSVSTVDGRTYALAGPIDGEEGKKFLLQNKPAKKMAGNCYARNDGRLEICLGRVAD